MDASEGWWQRVWAYVQTPHRTRSDATREMELLSALQMALWCVVLAWPAATFALPAYSPMRAAGLTETGWAMVFGLVGVAQAAGLALDRKGLRLLGLVGAAGLYGFLAVMLWYGNPIGTGWGGNLVLCWFALRALRRMNW